MTLMVMANTDAKYRSRAQRPPALQGAAGLPATDQQDPPIANTSLRFCFKLATGLQRDIKRDIKRNASMILGLRLTFLCSSASPAVS